MLDDRIPVTILGQSYEIVGNPADTLYYNSLAQYVEEKMREIQQATHIVSSQKIAVLAALNIADELFHERENKSHHNKSFDKKHVELIKLLDKILEDPSKPQSPGAFLVPRRG